MTKKSLRLKLCRYLLKFGEVQSDKGILYFEGELEIGTEVFMENEEGEMIPAADGDYVVDEKVITVFEGVVSEIKEAEVSEVVEEEFEDEETPNYSEAILTLSNEIEILKAEIENIKGVIEGLKKEATDQTAEMEFGCAKTKKNEPAWKRR